MPDYVFNNNDLDGIYLFILTGVEVDPDYVWSSNDLRHIYLAIVGGSGTNVTYLDPVISRINTPAVGPTTGDRYLVGTSPTGAWVGHANDIAEWDGAAWVYTDPVNDDVVYITSTLTTLRYNGTAWVAYQGAALLQNGNAFGGPVYIGSKDNTAVYLKSNNVNRILIGSGGNVRVANSTFFGNLTSTPTTTVDIGGTLKASGSVAVNGGIDLLYAFTGTSKTTSGSATGGAIRFVDSTSNESLKYLDNHKLVLFDNVVPGYYGRIAFSVSDDEDCRIYMRNINDTSGKFGLYHTNLNQDEIIFASRGDGVILMADGDIQFDPDGSGTFGGTVQADSYKSGDGSTGIDTTITTADLVGKTITVKDGLIVDFS